MTESTGDSQENELGREPAAPSDAPDDTGVDKTPPPDISDIDGATTGQHQVQEAPEPTRSGLPGELSAEQLASMPPPTVAPAASAETTKIAPSDPLPATDMTSAAPTPTPIPPPTPPTPPASVSDPPAASLGTDTVVANITPNDPSPATSDDPDPMVKVDAPAAADVATTMAAASPAPTSELVGASTSGSDPDPGKIDPGKTEIMPPGAGSTDGPSPTGELAIESPSADASEISGTTVDKPVDQAVDKAAAKKAKKAEKKAAKAAAKLAAAAPPTGSEGSGQPPGKTGGRRSKRLPVIGAVGLVTVVGLVLGAWLLDSASTSGQAARGTQLGTVDIGGLDEAEIGTVIDDLNEQLDATSLTIMVDDISIGTTPASLGAELDREQLTQAALDARRDGNIALRPIKWISSFWSTEEVDLQYRIDQDRAETGVDTVVSAALEQPVEPALEVQSGELRLATGSEGVSVDPAELIEELPAVLAGVEPFTIDLRAVPAVPELSDDDVQAVADDANDATEDNVIIRVLDSEVEVDPAAVRNWIGLDNEGAELDWVIDEARVLEDLKPLFPALGSEDQKAKFNVIDGQPLIIPASETVICCDTESITNVKDELLKPPPAVEEDDDDG